MSDQELLAARSVDATVEQRLRTTNPPAIPLRFPPIRYLTDEALTSETAPNTSHLKPMERKCRR